MLACTRLGSRKHAPDETHQGYDHFPGRSVQCCCPLVEVSTRSVIKLLCSTDRRSVHRDKRFDLMEAGAQLSASTAQHHSYESYY